MASVSSPLGQRKHVVPRLLYISSPEDRPEFQQRPHLNTKISGCFKDPNTFSLNTTPSRIVLRECSRQTIDVKVLKGTTKINQLAQRPRHNSVTSEPTLDQAIQTGVLRELLDVPSTKVDSSFRKGIARRKSSTTKPPPVFAQGLGQHESPCSQSQPDGTPNLDYTLAPKLLIVDNDGRILQYSTGGSLDRLPERIMQLRPGTIAVASDALPGKHWVLSIVRDARNCEEQKKGTWRGFRPRLLSKSSEDKCQVQELLLVFADPFSFNKWLITVRKQIESLGGLQYRPDLRGLDGEAQCYGPAHVPNGDNCALHFPPAPFVFPFAERQPLCLRTPSTSSSQSPRSPRSTAPPERRDSATESSLQSPTDLDRLRDSSLLEDVSISGTRSSYDDVVAVDVMSITSTGGRTSRFIRSPNIGSRPSNGLNRKKSLPAPLLLGDDGRKRALSCSPALPSPQIPRTPTLPTDTMHTLAGKFAPKTYTELHSPIEAAKMANWLDNLSKARQESIDDEAIPARRTPAPEPEDVVGALPQCPVSPISPTSVGVSFQNSEELSPISDDTTFTLPTECDSHTVKPPPPPYALAPNRTSSLDATLKDPQSQALSTAATSETAASTDDGKTLPLRVAGHLEKPTLKGDSHRGPPKKQHRKALSVVTGHDSLSIDTGHKSQRSPAVNDAHFATCFGVGRPFEKQSINIDGESMALPAAAKTLDFPPSPVLQQAIDLLLRSPSLPRQKRAPPLRQKSLPNILYRAEAPLSPPPTAPLPAVPDQSSTLHTP